MQAALHEYAGAAEFDGLANLLIDGVEIEDVAFLRRRSLQWPIKRAERAIFRAEVGVINVAVDDVSHGAFGMHLAAHRFRFHATPDQIIGPKHLHGLLFGQRHPLHPSVMAILVGGVRGQPSYWY